MLMKYGQKVVDIVGERSDFSSVVWPWIKERSSKVSIFIIWF